MSAALRTVLVLVLAAVVFVAWPSPLNATFPNVELGRGRTVLWEPGWWAALLVVVGVALRRPFARSQVGMFERVIATLGCVAVVAWVLLPAKANIDLLSPVEPGLTAMPLLGGGERVWSRATVEGNAFSLARAEMTKEYALMLLAGGIHEATSGASAVRTGLWTVMRGVANVALLGRLVGAVLAVWVAAMIWWPKEPLAVRKGVDAALRALAWLLPVANLAGLLVSALLLPDDAALRLRFGLTWGAAAVAVALAHLLGRRGTQP